jgi:predicted DNA-binding transcriptional regulator YafY
MSANKNAQKRYLILDKCLRKNKKWKWNELLEKVNEELGEEVNPKTGVPIQIGKTQLFKDLNDMETDTYNAPLVREPVGRTTYYYYEDKNYSIQNVPLNETEINQLKSAVQIMSRIKGAAQFDFLNEIIPTLESKLGLITTDKEVMSFDNNLDYEGMKYITPLFEAIINKQVLNITYQDFRSAEPYNIIFHPYYLKQYNNRWFVFGYNALTKNGKWNMALDRIKNMENTSDKYITSNTNWKDYFEDMIGVTKKDGVNEIELKLWFAPQQAPYIISKPLHLTQKKGANTEVGLEVKINVIPNVELEKLILSFGETVKVLSPKSFQKAIASRIKKSADLYL